MLRGGKNKPVKNRDGFRILRSKDCGVYQTQQSFLTTFLLQILIYADNGSPIFRTICKSGESGNRYREIILNFLACFDE